MKDYFENFMFKYQSQNENGEISLEDIEIINNSIKERRKTLNSLRKKKFEYQVKYATNFVKKNSAKCVLAIILSGVILSLSNACSSDDRKFKDFKLVDAVALDTPISKTRRLISVSGVDRDYVEKWETISSVEDGKQPNSFYFDDEVVLFESKVSVDVNNDGKHDLWLHIAVRDNYKDDRKKGVNYEIDAYQNYALNNIQKGTKLLLEGIVQKDIIHENVITDVVYPGNGINFFGVDYERGSDYIDMQNLVAIDGTVLKEPMNKNNKKIINERFLSNQR